MRNDWFGYIKIYEADNYVLASGISFEEFYSGISAKPRNLLFLEGWPPYERRHEKLLLYYLTTEELKDFSQQDVGFNGDFCWIDYENAESLDAASKQDMAEILYFKHFKKPFGEFRFKNIKNQFAYYAHDDNWYTKIYMANPKDYLQVVEHKVLKELKGRKRSLTQIPQAILEEIYLLCLDGVIFDFEYAASNEYQAVIRIYQTGELDDVDGAHRELDRLRKCKKGVRLEYSPELKKWALS